MKKIIILSFLAVIILLSCKSENKHGALEDSSVDSIDAAYSELDTTDMQNISLVDYNLNLLLKVPIVASSSGQEITPVIDHVDGDYLWYIIIGDHFKLVIEDYAKEFNKVVAHQKRLAAQKNVFTVEYLIEEPHLLFYKRELVEDNGGLPSFHCYAEVTLDGYNYVLRSVTFGGFEQVIRDMVQSIRTVRPVYAP